MNPSLSQLPTIEAEGNDPLAVLDNFEVQERRMPEPAPVVAPKGTDDAARARILEALAVSLTYASQLADPDTRKNLEDKLKRSNVSGSSVSGIQGPDDVVAMLSSVKNWQEVATTLQDKKITVLEGELPAGTKAFTAYAQLREIHDRYGDAGLGTVQPKKGYQKAGEFYFCTLQRMPTNRLTVQLKADDLGNERLHMWFAGKELTSYLRLSDADQIVRMGTVIQPVAPIHAAPMAHRGYGKNYNHRR